MNKIIKVFVIVFAITLSFIFNSCDDFKKFPINIPFSVGIITQGSNSTITSFGSYCLNQSSTYQQYVKDNKIKKLTFIQAAWRTDSVSSGLTGTVIVTVRKFGGETLFQKTVAGTNPAAYKSPNGPYILELSATEISAFNTYLEQYLKNSNTTPCLEAGIQVTVTSGTQPYYLKGYVDMVVDAETEL